MSAFDPKAPVGPDVNAGVALAKCREGDTAKVIPILECKLVNAEFGGSRDDRYVASRQKERPPLLNVRISKYYATKAMSAKLIYGKTKE